MPRIWSQDDYLEALDFATAEHARVKQFVPGTKQPYVVHVVKVAQEVMAAICAEPVENPDLAVLCALLHDTLEDTQATPEMVEERFGAAVVRGVRALTKDDGLQKRPAMEDSLRRIREQPREVWMVKLADRITNLAKPPGHWNDAKIARYKDEARLILAELGEASSFLAARLRSRIEEYPPRS